VTVALIPVRLGDLEFLVEASPAVGTEPTSRTSLSSAHIGDVFKRAQVIIADVAASTVKALHDSAAGMPRPEEMEMTFGIRFSAQGDVVVVHAGGEATLSVRLMFRAAVLDSANVPDPPSGSASAPVTP
jgi:Trypsin-co-occurring domain 1